MNTVSQELPIPVDPAKRKGFVEVARIWAKRRGRGQTIAISTGTKPYKKVRDWSVPMASLAEQIAKQFDIGDSRATGPVEFSVVAALLLRHSAGLTGVDGMIDAVLSPKEELHPGTMGVPEQLAEDPEAREIVSIWRSDNTDAPCPDCGEVHGTVTFCNVFDEIEPEELGSLLARAVSAHVSGSSDDPVEQIKIAARVEQAFHDHFFQGVNKKPNA